MKITVMDERSRIDQRGNLVGKSSIVIEVEVEKVTRKALFRAKAMLDDLIPASCDNCGGTDIRANVREVHGGEYVYYSAVCASCKYEFRYGETKVGKDLFPKGWEPPYRGNSGGEEKARTNAEEELF